MKLYTEEQVMIAYNMGVDDGHNGAISLQINELSLTPIKLPIDEDIDDKIEDSSYSLEYNTGFRFGAKWVIEQIKQKSIGH